MNRRDFACTNDGVQLAGSLYVPDGQPPYPAMIVLHAAQGGTRDYPFYRHLIELLPSRGIAVLLYDRRGSGGSSGDLNLSDFNDLAGDAIAAMDWLLGQDDIDPGRIGVYGISQGGWIAPLVAAQRPGVAFLIIVSGSGVSPARQMEYAAITHLQRAGFSAEVVARAVELGNRVNDYYRGKRSFEDAKRVLAEAEKEPWFPYTFLETSEQLPRDVTGAKWYYEMDYDPLPAWGRVTQPALFLFAEDDEWVPVPESMTEFQSVTGHLRETKLLQIPGTDHMMAAANTGAVNAVPDAYFDALLSWVKGRIETE